MCHVLLFQNYKLIDYVLLFQGCKVIGYTGADDKVKWLKEELGFDFAFNYKKVDLGESLQEAAPEGVDVFFDVVSEMKHSAYGKTHPVNQCSIQQHFFGGY